MPGTFPLLHNQIKSKLLGMIVIGDNKKTRPV